MLTLLTQELSSIDAGQKKINALTAVSGIKRKSKENMADDVENTPSWEQWYKSVTLLFN